MGPGRYDQSPRGKGALEAGSRMDFQAALGHELADEAAFEHDFADVRVGVQQISLFFDHQPAMGPKILRDRLSDLIIGQVHMAAAFFAHGGFRRRGHLQVGPAVEATDLLLRDERLSRLDRASGLFLDAEMLLAFLADSGVSAARLGLHVAALGARDRDCVLFRRRHGRRRSGHC